MGNMGSSGSAGRRRRGSRRGNRHNNPPPPPVTHQPESSTPVGRYVGATAAAAAVPGQYYQYPGYYPPPPTAMPMPLPAPYDHHHRGGSGGGGGGGGGNWVGGRYPPASAAAVAPAGCGPGTAPPPPYVEHQKAVTIRNDVNLKKESLRVDADVDNPGKVLVCFTFDATVAGSMTIIFFAKEGEDCNLTPTKDDHISPVTVHFEQGLGQNFRQPTGTGIDLSMFEESELVKSGDATTVEVYPLAVKAEATALSPGSNSQITLAIFEMVKGELRARVSKQILWVNGMRYELQEIYGIGNSVEDDLDGNDPGKECVICLSEPRDTTVLPCRHMCMCSDCAKVLRLQTNRCPICRQPVERLLEIKVNNIAAE